MKLEFIELKLKNFLSFGNVEQSIKLNKNQYTLITGINKDKSEDDEGNVNGAGKTTIFQALHYALFGKAIGNKVHLPTLVNNINKKNMVVTLTFRKDETMYRIERGRNPSFLHFYKEDEEITDESLGDSRDTQTYIEDLIGMTDDMFCQTIMLSCSVPIFLEQSTANQKAIIEKILGIDIITKKINALKEVIKEYKNNINNEEFKVVTLKNNNDSLKQQYQEQINKLELSLKEWDDDRKNKIEATEELIKKLSSINYEEEKKLIDEWDNYQQLLFKKEENDKKKNEIETLIEKQLKEVDEYNRSIKNLSETVIKQYRDDLDYNETIKKEEEEYKQLIDKKKDVKKRYDDLQQVFKQLTDEVKKRQTRKEEYKNNVCPYCHQVLDKEVAQSEIEKLDKEIEEFEQAIHQVDIEIMEVNSDLQDYPEDNKEFEYKNVCYKTLADLELDIQTNELMIKNKALCDEKIKQLKNELSEFKSLSYDEPDKKSSYSSKEELDNLKMQLEVNRKALEEVKNNKVNPYQDMLKDAKKKLKEVPEVDETTLNDLKETQSHNEMLLKLLNSPSSFIRQSILDKSLVFLNTKIRYYLDKLESLHIVKFNNDMSVDISYMGNTYGYISSGEMGRVAIALTLAFRDAWESLSGIDVNLLMVDEVLDKSGLDVNGVQLLVQLLQSNENKNTFVVSHNTNVTSTAINKLTIVRERSFSNIQA